MTKETQKPYEEFWGETMAREEPLREQKFPLVDIQTAITRRVIARFLDKPLNILDAGAGTGRYSLPLAGDGHQLTHLDVSEQMLSLAKESAQRVGLPNIRFLRGDIVEMPDFKDRAFDMVLCLDAPISYCYPNQDAALEEVCRVAGNLVVLMVSSRGGVVPFMANYDLQKEFVPDDYDTSDDPFMMARTTLEKGVEDFPPEILDYLNKAGKLAPLDYAFTVDELVSKVTALGFIVEILGGPGALARNLTPENLEKVRGDRTLFQRFIDLSMVYDFDPFHLGMGAVNLLLVGRRI